VARVTLEGIAKTFARSTPPAFALRGVTLEVPDGTCLAIVGPSGCGKTTLLRIVAGLERADRGCVRFDDRDVTHVPPEARAAALVFASDALFPHLSAYENIAYAPRRRAPRDVARIVRDAAERMRVADLLQRRPGELSSGQRQRVALARALAMEPAVLLLDEPFARLDAPLRAALRIEVAQLRRARALTTLFVTHDQSEAMALGETVAVMCDGEIAAAGAARELYERPPTAFVAGFLGSPAMAFVTPESIGLSALGAGVRIGVRADAVRVDERGGLRGIVRAVEDFGSDAYAHVDGSFGSLAVRILPTQPLPRVGEAIAFAIDAERVHAFDARGLRLPQTADV